MSYEIGKKLIKQKQYKKAIYIFSKLLENNSRDLRAIVDPFLFVTNCVP